MCAYRSLRRVSACSRWLSLAEGGVALVLMSLSRVFMKSSTASLLGTLLSFSSCSMEFSMVLSLDFWQSANTQSRPTFICISIMLLQLPPQDSLKFTAFRNSLMLRYTLLRTSQRVLKLSLPRLVSSFPPLFSQSSITSLKLLRRNSQLLMFHTEDLSQIYFCRLSRALVKEFLCSAVFSSRTTLKARQAMAMSADMSSWVSWLVSVLKPVLSLPSLLLSSISSPTVACTFSSRLPRMSYFFIAIRFLQASMMIFCQLAVSLQRRWARSRCCTASCISPYRQAISESDVWILPMSSLLESILAQARASLRWALAMAISPKSMSTFPISNQQLYLERGCMRLGGGRRSKLFPLSLRLIFWYSALSSSSFTSWGVILMPSKSILRVVSQGCLLAMNTLLSLSSSSRWQWSFWRMCLAMYLVRKRRGMVWQSRPMSASMSASLQRQAQVSSGFSRAQLQRKFMFYTLPIFSMYSLGSSQEIHSSMLVGMEMVLQTTFSSFSFSLAAFSCSSLKVEIDFSSILMACLEAFMANVTLLPLLVWIEARMVQILKSLSKCRQLSDSGLGSSSLCEKTLLVFLFLMDLAALPDLLILELPLNLDLLEMAGFLSALLLMSLEDLRDLVAKDFLLLRLRLLLFTVMPQSSASPSSRSLSGSISISVRILLAYYRFLTTVSTGSLPTLSCHSEYSMSTSTISTECSFLRISSALLQAACCLETLGAILASLSQSLAWREGSASLMLLMACSSFLPCLDMKAILASQMDFCRFLGSRSSIMSATSSPSLKQLFSQVARKQSWESRRSRSHSLSSFSSLRKSSTVRTGCISLLLLALLSCSRAHTFHTCFPASSTRMFIPHLNPFLAAYTPRDSDSISKPSTLPASWVFGFTSFSRDQDDRNYAKLYHLRRLEGMEEGSPSLLWAKAFSEHLRAYLSILEFYSLEANLASLTQSSACSSSSVSSCSFGFQVSRPSKHLRIWASQSALLGEFWMSSSWLEMSRMKVSLNPGAF